MWKALLKKQWLSVVAFFRIGKNGKARSPMAALGFAVLMVYAFGAMGIMFWELSKTFCAPLVGAGLDWVYFSVMGLMASAFGFIGGVFTAKSRLYEAKDNDLLLSMPIPVGMLLLIRMIGLYLFTLLFEVMVFAPALVQYYVTVGVQWNTLLLGILTLFLMPLGTVALCCLLGFVLAWITARLPYKNLFTIIGFMAFMVLYFLAYSKINEYITYVIAHGEAVGATMQTTLFPFAQLGKAAAGDGIAFLWFLLLFVGVFALVYWALSVTYIRIATMKKGERYAKYKEKAAKTGSVKNALLKKEFLRLIKSPMYLLNASMGTFMTLLVCVMTLVQGDVFGMTKETVETAQLSETIALILVAATCFMASSNTVSACSVSLEGQSLWLVQSLPVASRTVLFSKILVHFCVTALPVALCGVVMSCVVGAFWCIPLVILTATIAAAAFATLGLAINLKFPNLHWTNETAAVKQSLSVMFAMFGGWGVTLLCVGGYFLFGKYMPIWGYVGLCLALFLALTVGGLLWIKNRGVKIFENL